MPVRFEKPSDDAGQERSECQSRPRSPIQTAGSKKPAFSFVFKHLSEFGIVKTALVVLR